MHFDVAVYSKTKFRESLKETHSDDNAKVVMAAVEAASAGDDSVFALLACEYWDDYNPRWELPRLIQALAIDVTTYDGVEELDKYSIGTNHQAFNAEEWYSDNTGKSLPAHPYDDDYDDDKDIN